MPLKCAPIIQKIKDVVAAADPTVPRKTLFVFLIKITQDGKTVQEYTLDLKELKAYDGPSTGAFDVTITIDDEALFLFGAKMMTKEEATKQNKLKIEGNKEAIGMFLVIAEKFKEGKLKA